MKNVRLSSMVKLLYSIEDTVETFYLIACSFQDGLTVVTLLNATMGYDTRPPHFAQCSVKSSWDAMHLNYGTSPIMQVQDYYDSHHFQTKECTQEIDATFGE
ncbi:hypothetical protein ABKN59_011271 [Abortiporus biennis]